MIKTIDELVRYQAECTKKMEDRNAGVDGKRAIFLCGGVGCLSAESEEIKKALEEKIAAKGLSDKISVNMGGCFGYCSMGPFVRIYPEMTIYCKVTPADVDEIVEKDLVGGEVVERLLFTDPATGEKIRVEKDIPFYKKQVKIALHGSGAIDPESIEDALGVGAFQGLVRALKMDRQEVINEILKSGLRGRGGGGFATGRKWQFCYNEKNDEKYVICNGDEGDPGAFMDRSILEGNPLAVIEGMAIAGYAIGAKNGYFYIRAEYPIAAARIENMIKMATEAGLLGDNILGTGFSFHPHIRLGAGAFVCGEETALIHSIEGQRGMPTARPPYPAVKGLWQKPSIVNNVETLACVPWIMREGADKFAALGTEKSKGTKVFALGGKVNNVGLVEVPMGTTLRELIYDIGGGIQNDKKFKAIQTGGPSGGCLTEKDIDTEIDFDTLVARGSMMGSGGAIVMDEDNCMVDVAKFYMDFICDESCGKCSPCRIGTKRLMEYLIKITEGKATMEDLDSLQELAKVIQANSLCALGQTAANPILSTLNQFRDEYVAHIVDKKCPAHVCKSLMQYVIDQDKCIGCGLCKKNCPVGAISVTDYVAPGHKLASCTIDPEKCIKCGVCQANCKFGAITKE